eukprot:7095114-Pyramimonas_sp.AAC.1
MTSQWHSRRRKEWEKKVSDQGVFSMAPGRSAVDAVWRQQIRGDLAVANRQESLTVLGDLKQCYEHVLHPQLVRACADWQYPLFTVRFAMRTYQWARVLSMEGMVSEELEPGQGIVAGSSTATFEIKCYCIPTVNRFLELGFAPALAVRIDDFSLNMHDSCIHSCVRNTALAMAFLVEQLSSLFNLRFVLNKFAITGASAERVELAQGQLGQCAGEFNHSIINLGVDFAPGKTKSRLQAKAKRKE